MYVYSYIISYYHFGETSLEEKAKIGLLGFLSSDKAFDFLRTKNTLGYVCFSMTPAIRDQYGFSLNVGSQTDKFTVEDVYTKMTEFNQHFLDILKENRLIIT